MRRIISYNVNGIRSAISKGFVGFLSQISADVICLQEIKAQPSQFNESDFISLGYKCYSFPAEKKGYSGVAIFSKQVPDRVIFGMKNEKYDVEGRVIRVDFPEFSVISVYFPSGTTGGLRQSYKMDFLSDFQQYIGQLHKTCKNIVISGDFNICRLWIDIHNPEKQQKTSGFLPEEREWFANFLNDGFIDTFREIEKGMHKFSWWSYRAGARKNNKGWRIDYHIVSSEMKARILGAKILPEVFHSDHCPVLLDLDF